MYKYNIQYKLSIYPWILKSSLNHYDLYIDFPNIRSSKHRDASSLDFA